MTNPQGTPIWYELLTSDLAAAAPFYRAVLGWSIAAQADPPGVGMDYRMIVRADGGMAGGAMMIDAAMAASGVKPGWLIYFGVDDVDASVARILSLGGTVRMPALTMEGVGRMALLADPQGAAFYVMRGASEESSDVFSVTNAGHGRWNELSTRDGPAALAFYQAALGLEHKGGMPMGDAGDYSFISAGDAVIGAISPTLPPEAQPAWLVYFGVESIAAAKRAIEANGGTVSMGPMEVPGDDWIIIGNDPQGAAFGVVGPKGE